MACPNCLQLPTPQYFIPARPSSPTAIHRRNTKFPRLLKERADKARLLNCAVQKVLYDDAAAKSRSLHRALYASRFLGWLDILVHAEEVVRIVLALHLGEAIVVRAVGGAHAIALVGGEEIDVDAAAGEGRRGLEEVARPAMQRSSSAGSSQRPWTFMTNSGIAVRVRRGAPAPAVWWRRRGRRRRSRTAATAASRCTR